MIRSKFFGSALWAALVMASGGNPATWAEEPVAKQDAKEVKETKEAKEPAAAAEEPPAGAAEPTGAAEPSDEPTEPAAKSDEPGRSGDEPARAGDEPKKADDEPAKSDDESKKSDEPKKGDEEPAGEKKDDAKEGKPGADEPKKGDDEPAGDEPAAEAAAATTTPPMTAAQQAAEPRDGTDAPPPAAEPKAVKVTEAPEKTAEAVESTPSTLGQPSGNSTDAPPVTPAEAPLTPELEALRSKVRKCLMSYYHEPISVNDHSPWGIMHALIAYGVDTEVYVGDRKVNAIGWLCYNGTCRGQKMMYVENGKIRVRIGPGVQGHPGQFLSMLAQSRVRTDFPIKIDGQNFTVADLIQSEKETCRSRTELTFKLIGLSHYLNTDEKWRNDLGEEWSLPKLIREELAQPVIGAACGGTHRMNGFSYAVNKRNKVGEPFEGQWLRAEKFVNDYHEYTFRLQNSDGSFSTNWFAGRGDWGETPRRVETTGHILEWLVCSLPKEDLDDPRVLKAVNFLADTMMTAKQQRRKFEIGPRGHALHGLAIYDERRFGDKPGNRDLILAKQPKSPATSTIKR